jgi:hypothetical protein
MIQSFEVALRQAPFLVLWFFHPIKFEKPKTKDFGGNRSTLNRIDSNQAVDRRLVASDVLGDVSN